MSPNLFGAPIENMKFGTADQVIAQAAQMFRVLAAPIRLKIVSCLCEGEQNASELLRRIDTTQPNMSLHLKKLCCAGVLAKRRDGVNIYYRIANNNLSKVCKAVFGHVH